MEIIMQIWHNTLQALQAKIGNWHWQHKKHESENTATTTTRIKLMQNDVSLWNAHQNSLIEDVSQG